MSTVEGSHAPPDAASRGASIVVERATADDLAVVRAAYENGRRAQRERMASVWPEFGDGAILAEIESGALWRVTVDGTVAGVFTVAYADPAIWGEHERGAHIYLHRIARSAAFGGRRFIETVLGWAREHARALGREGVRMDTWASNERLVAYYGRLGFRLLERRTIPPDERLAALYHGLELALLEDGVRYHARDDRSPDAMPLEPFAPR